MSRCVGLLAVFVACLWLAGCGGQTIAPVKGRVMFKGKPVKEAHLTFSPIGKSEDEQRPGKPATGMTDEEGYYVLSTFAAGDGALIREHRVTIDLDDTNPARAKRRTETQKEVIAGANEINFDLD